jgi:transcriptional regulator with XRE-family HTH domain
MKDELFEELQQSVREGGAAELAENWRLTQEGRLPKAIEPLEARIESGRSTPRVDTLERLLRACGVQLDLVPIAGEGVDRTAIRRLLALSAGRRGPQPREGAPTARRMRSHPFDPIAAIRALERHRVRYVVIGGFAGRLWGSPSLTNDLDICYAREPENLVRLAAALRRLKARLRGVGEKVPFLLDAKTLEAGDHFTFETQAGRPPGCSVGAGGRKGRPYGTRGTIAATVCYGM